MITFEEFESGLQEALAHFRDPAYPPPAAVCAVLGCDLHEGMPAIQAAVIRAIEALEPPAEAPAGAYSRVVHEVLHQRFVLGVTQEEVAYQLHVSRRTVNRLQRRAARALAGVLWERSHDGRQAEAGLHTAEEGRHPPQRPAAIEALGWEWQMQRELESLRAKAPDALSDVGEVIASVIELADTLSERLGVRVQVRFVQPGLTAAVHPVVLSQMLLAIVRRWGRYTLDGQLAIYATLEGGHAKITLTGAAATELGSVGPAQGIPVPEGITIETCLDGHQAFVWLRVPSAGRVTVLVVDDNEDIVRLYRDAALGTRYHIVHTARGSDLFEVVAATAPQLIVLDIMLPDVDGWRLLLRLHEDPATRQTPVVVCSVVGDEELALSLGAARYLAKPVRPKEFIQALDEALAQDTSAAATAPGCT